MYQKPRQTTDRREQGRVILAHGESTGHVHEVLAATDTGLDIPPMEYFEEPDGRRVLLILAPCLLRHDEHAPIALDPAQPVPVRQGDVYLRPLGPGAWQVIRQSEWTGPEAWRVVAD